MGQSRGRKTKSKKLKLSQFQNQNKMPNISQKTLWEKIRDHPFFWTFGVIAALVAIGEPIHQAFVEPDISSENNADVSSPLAAPFTVKNRSWLFSMDGAALQCAIQEATFSAFVMRGTTIVSGSATVKPSAEGAFRCRIGASAQNSIRITPANLTIAHMFLSMKYTILWVIPRSSPPIEFTWYTKASPPRWVRGIIAD